MTDLPSGFIRNSQEGTAQAPSGFVRGLVEPLTLRPDGITNTSPLITEDNRAARDNFLSSTSVGRVLSAFGEGVEDGFGMDQLELCPNLGDGVI